MTDFEIGDLSQLTWLWLVAVLTVITAGAIRANRRAVLRFASKSAVQRIFPRFSVGRQILSTALFAAVLVLVVVSLTDVRWGRVEREIPQRGIEVMFLLDVSRSMLAEDVAPNRLKRGKQMIKDLIDEMAGDRVGLTVFSGDARQRIPLTNHYDDFKQTLDEVTPDDVFRGGSRIGVALEQAAKGFYGKTNNHKVIVLISDGEDQQSNPLDVATKIQEEYGLRIISIGLGDTQEGGRIPVIQNGVKRYLQYEGQQVWTKLDGEVLKQIATQTGGVYIPAETKQVSMRDVYRGYFAPIEDLEFETARVNTYESRYQWFCFIAFALLAAEVFVRTRRSPVTASA